MLAEASGPAQPSDEDVRNAIFIIEAKKRTGTGSLILDRQHVLTAYHVIEGIQPEQEKVSVRNVKTKEPYSAVVQLPLAKWDVALLRLDKPIEDGQVMPF